MSQISDQSLLTESNETISNDTTYDEYDNIRNQEHIEHEDSCSNESEIR